MRSDPTGARWWTFVGVAYFVVATASLIWPVYPALGNRIEPRLLGLPFSLTYVLGVVIVNTGVLAALYRARVIDSEEVEPRDGEARSDEVPGDG